MTAAGVETEIADGAARERAVGRLREVGLRLPQFAELADPRLIPETGAEIDPDSPDPRNLYRCHWYNADDRRGRAAVPAHLVLPESLTGVPARIVVALGNRFPMIGAHKVLAAYGCLAPRLVTGGFDPTRHRAVWPSTGNYCRGGIAISRILGCRGVAVLPEGMSRERFDWLDRWVAEPSDIHRTPGTESNVKEIYDACKALATDPQNVILNQFSEYGNYLIHELVTGTALAHVFSHLNDAAGGGLRARAFVAASGSAGTLAAGDRLKRELGAAIAVVEATECPTLLRAGYGEHNIQGIGDKHVPLIHNVMNTDFVIGVSERDSDSLNLVFNTDPGREHLIGRKGVPEVTVRAIDGLGLSSIANVVAAVKLAKYLDLGVDDVVLTVATDGAALYGSEHDRAIGRWFGGNFDALAAAEGFGRHMLGAGTGDLLEATRVERKRIFNQGYYTWVEQQGVSLADFDRRRDPAFWDELRTLVPRWDALIAEFNTATGANA
jgi:cysteine synthase